MHTLAIVDSSWAIESPSVSLDCGTEAIREKTNLGPKGRYDKEITQMGYTNRMHAH